MDLTTFALNFNHLRLFLAVAEYGGVTRAADAVFVSQPAVSKAVQELERQVGVPLLEHIGRRVALTEAGEILAGYARRIFTLAAEGRGRWMSCAAWSGDSWRSARARRSASICYLP